MAVDAFVLITVDGGQVPEVVSALQKIAGVQRAQAVTGPYDVIAVVEAPDLRSLGEMVAGQVRGIPGVEDTITCISV